MSGTMFPRAIVEQFAIEGFARGWSEALDAAREAVEGCRTDLRGYLGKTDALAAIDALRRSHVD